MGALSGTSGAGAPVVDLVTEVPRARAALADAWPAVAHPGDASASAAPTAHTARRPRGGLLLAVAGADPALAARVPKERATQTSLGAVLIGTAGVASASAAYAAHVALHLPLWVTALPAPAWGLFVLAVDRWLLLATPRVDAAWKALAMAAPRLLLALLLGTVMSEPLTLAVFSREIATELPVMAAERDAAFTRQLVVDPRFAGLPRDTARLADLQATIAAGVTDDAVRRDPAVVDAQRRADEASAAAQAAQAQVTCEVEGTCGSGKAGAGAAYDLKLAARDDAAANAADLQRQLAATTAAVTAQRTSAWATQRAADVAQLRQLQAHVAAAQRERAAAEHAHAAAVQGAGGLLDRITALARLEDRSPALRLAHLALFAFLLAVECLPVLFKTLLQLAPRSTYEELVALEAQTALVTARARAGAAQEADGRATAVLLDAQLAVTTARLRAWREASDARIDLDTP